MKGHGPIYDKSLVEARVKGSYGTTSFNGMNTGKLGIPSQELLIFCAAYTLIFYL
jgi:glycerol kinase